MSTELEKAILAANIDAATMPLRVRIAALEAENAELRERKDGAYEERNRVVAPAREEG